MWRWSSTHIITATLYLSRKILNPQFLRQSTCYCCLRLSYLCWLLDQRMRKRMKAARSCISPTICLRTSTRRLLTQSIPWPWTGWDFSIPGPLWTTECLPWTTIYKMRYIITIRTFQWQCYNMDGCAMAERLTIVLTCNPGVVSKTTVLCPSTKHFTLPVPVDSAVKIITSFCWWLRWIWISTPSKDVWGRGHRWDGRLGGGGEGKGVSYMSYSFLPLSTQPVHW